MNKTTLTTIIIIVVIAIAGGVFFMMMGNKPSTDSSLVSSQGGIGGALGSTGVATGPAVGSNVLALLQQVNSIEIHPEFFRSSLFASLQDITQQVHAVDMGKRPDPFASVPGVPSSLSQGKSQTQTPSKPKVVAPVQQPVDQTQAADQNPFGDQTQTDTAFGGTQ